MYESAPNKVADLLMNPLSAGSQDRNSDGNVEDGTVESRNVTSKDSQAPLSLSIGGLSSFKVLTECPLIIMLLFQTYSPKYAQKNMPKLLTSMMYFLSINAPLFLSARDFGGGVFAASVQLSDLFSAQVCFL